MAMAKLIHMLMCNVSRRYRARHCHHVDELPMRIQRRLLASIQEEDPRTWNSAEDMMHDLLQEIDEEEQQEKTSFRKVASFA